MSEPNPSLFYSFKIVTKDKIVQGAVWNGLKDYENHPDKLVLATYGNVIIAQIGRPVGGSTGRSLVATAKGIIQAQKTDFLIFWARDNETYQSCKNDLRLTATISADAEMSPLPSTKM